MEELLKKIADKSDLLVTWVRDMTTLTQNPYSAGLNVPKVLEDLGGYATDLRRDVAQLEEDIKQMLTPEAESATVEQ